MGNLRPFFMLEFLVYILATWRLARLLAEEAGPFDVLERLRHLAGVPFLLP